MANTEVKRAIETAKRKYRSNLEEEFTQEDLCLALEGLKTMAAFNIATTDSISSSDNSPSSLSDDLNNFFTRTLQQFIWLCDEFWLELKSTKTKELIVTFFNWQRELAVLTITTINGSPDGNHLHSIVKTCSKIFGLLPCSLLTVVYEQQLCSITRRPLQDGLGAESKNLYPFLLPVIQLSTDVSQPPHVYLLEDGLELWYG
ncbi:hypothetical protein XENOCAPTIV_000914 [Xenoophorus captivus]|uniref:Importin-7/11-like TPR repeats domain-containing protein n=1 Tax=Xenoophorus captivus TaxID=1517983 RepID=A0ABV0QP59_9TELE